MEDFIFFWGGEGVYSPPDSRLDPIKRRLRMIGSLSLSLCLSLFLFSHLPPPGSCFLSFLFFFFFCNIFFWPVSRRPIATHTHKKKRTGDAGRRDWRRRRFHRGNDGLVAETQSLARNVCVLLVCLFCEIFSLKNDESTTERLRLSIEPVGRDPLPLPSHKKNFDSALRLSFANDLGSLTGGS